MVGKPLFKKVIKAVNKSRKDIRAYRKSDKTVSSKEFRNLNQAQERLETARDVRNVSSKILQQRKFPKEAQQSFGKAFDGVIKKRAGLRNVLADPRYLKTKKNKRGGFI